MYSVEKMKDYLKNHLKKKRYQHCLRVAKLSEKLAKVYGISETKAYFAGLVHDIAKELDNETCLKYIDKIGIDKDQSILAHPNLAHGEIGAYILKETFHIKDEEILEAVKWHTYGNVNMSVLSKIIYLADVAEPMRSFDGIETLRALMYLNLDDAIKFQYESSIAFLSDQNQIMHQNTKRMINDLKLS